MVNTTFNKKEDSTCGTEEKEPIKEYDTTCDTELSQREQNGSSFNCKLIEK